MAYAVFLVANMAMAEDFSGKWESDFGLVELMQTGEHVTGTYSCCNGNIAGRVNGPRLEFTWQDPMYGNGWGQFVMSQDRKRLDGVWGQSGQQTANGKWNAVRFAAPPMRGTPSYWTVSGLNAPTGSLEGKAELFIAEDKVSGKIDGKYSMPIQGQIQKIDVFNYVEGRATEQGMQLRWRNPIDGSAGTMDLQRSAGRLVGSWVSDDGKSRGSISFTETKQKTDVDLDPVLEHQSKQRRAEQLLQSAMNAASSDEATRQYQEAAKLYREIGDMNKVGYALYGQATDELSRDNYDKAQQLYDEVLTLGDAVDPTIRSLAMTGRNMTGVVRGAKEQGR